MRTLVSIRMSAFLAMVLVVCGACGPSDQRAPQPLMSATVLSDGSGEDELTERTKAMFDAIQAGEFDELQRIAGPAVRVRPTVVDPNDAAEYVWLKILDGEYSVSYRGLSFAVRFESNGSVDAGIVSVRGEMKVADSDWIPFERAVAYERVDGGWELRHF